MKNKQRKIQVGDDGPQQASNSIVPRQVTTNDGGLRSVSRPRQVRIESDSLPPVSSLTRTTRLVPLSRGGEQLVLSGGLLQRTQRPVPGGLLDTSSSIVEVPASDSQAPYNAR